MLQFHCCWHYIFTDYPYLSLKDKGFSVAPISDEMINGFKCNSLFFQEEANIQELQFRELLDEEEFIAALKFRQERRGSAHDLLRPGISFRHDSINEEFILDGLAVNIGAGKNIPTSVFAQSEKLSTVQNSKYKVAGLVWNLNPNDLEYFCHRTNLKVQDHKIKVGENFDIFIPEKNSELYQVFESRKDFPFWAVVLQVDPINAPHVDEDWDEVQTIQWNKQNALLIKNHITQWDILISFSRPSLTEVVS